MKAKLSQGAQDNQNFVQWFRNSSPYIHTHRGKTFVIKISGETIASDAFTHIVQDIALLNSLGIKLVIVHGARPQIEARLKERKIKNDYHKGYRITDNKSLACVKEAVGSVRVEIEALLSMGVANSPMSGAKLRVASGNFVTAKPLGVRDGVDLCHSGEVRKIDGSAITQLLDQQSIVLLSPAGYSPTGEVFNLRSEDVATAVAIELAADKLFFLLEEKGLMDAKRKIVSQATPDQVDQILNSKRKLSDEINIHLEKASEACRAKVSRCHLIQGKTDGALLLECFSRDGIGTLITAHQYEDLRQAMLTDIGGILNLIEPLEKAGFLVKRSKEMLELEVQNFFVIERDGLILGCAALNQFPNEQAAELVCLAVHEDYRETGRGDKLLDHIVQVSLAQKLSRLFVLTTRTLHWFKERGFVSSDVGDLPMGRKKLYNYKRNSKVLVKHLTDPSLR